MKWELNIITFLINSVFFSYFKDPGWFGVFCLFACLFCEKREQERAWTCAGKKVRKIWERLGNKQ